MSSAERLKKKLKKYKREDIIITDHAEEQAIFRNVDLEEVKENILNPKRLAHVEKQKAKKKGEEKYDCYFPYKKLRCHRYILVLNKECVVCTIINIRTNWQRIVEKKKKDNMHKRY